ncbi:MAG: hypothetical protein KGL53_11215, partial [Elusimicrobia bacterium]|nr:hypothetical protein [Elusimicrobiota bacterium]
GEAESALRKGAALSPDSPEAHARLGVFLYAAGRLPSGRKELERSRRLLAGYPLACLALSWMDLERNDADAARAVLREALAHPVVDDRMRHDLTATLNSAEGR